MGSSKGIKQRDQAKGSSKGIKQRDQARSISLAQGSAGAVKRLALALVASRLTEVSMVLAAT